MCRLYKLQVGRYHPCLHEIQVGRSSHPTRLKLAHCPHWWDMRVHTLHSQPLTCTALGRRADTRDLVMQSSIPQGKCNRTAVCLASLLLSGLGRQWHLVHQDNRSQSDRGRSCQWHSCTAQPEWLTEVSVTSRLIIGKP